jgi:hypothetical protein
MNCQIVGCPVAESVQPLKSTLRNAHKGWEQSMKEIPRTVFPFFSCFSYFNYIGIQSPEKELKIESGLLKIYNKVVCGEKKLLLILGYSSNKILNYFNMKRMRGPSGGYFFIAVGALSNHVVGISYSEQRDLILKLDLSLKLTSFLYDFCDAG